LCVAKKNSELRGVAALKRLRTTAVDIEREGWREKEIDREREREKGRDTEKEKERGGEREKES
jgi:hypothetical protein